MLIKRSLFPEIINQLTSPEIAIIVGPRQVGKTTLLLQVKEYLDQKGEKTLFLNYDLDADRPFFGSQNDLINKIKLNFGEKRGFVFLDEIQRKENAGLFLKGLYDLRTPYKFIVTGSGSLELKEKIHESLAGRKRLFNLDPVSFWEFLNFRTDYQYEGREREFLQVEKMQSENILSEYLMFGGYPKVILASSLVEKQAAISDIFQSFLEKDIAILLRVEKTEDLSKLIHLVAFQQGQLINFSELSRSVGISQPTVKQFLWYLEKTFIFQRVFPFSRKRKEIVKSPTIYFKDLGLSNFLKNQFGAPLNQVNTAGLTFQNLIFQLLEMERIPNQSFLNYWRSKDKAEVDFILDRGDKPLPIEVKFAKLSKPEIPLGLVSFIKKYQPPLALLLNLNFEAQKTLGQTKVLFLPFYELGEMLRQ